MAVYIRFAASENVSPIIVGEMITPSRYNWNAPDGRANCTGDFISGTGLIGWWYSYDPGFNAFFNNNYINGIAGTYTHSWKLYSNEDYSLQFKMEVSSYPLGKFNVRILYNGSDNGYYPAVTWNGMLQGYSTPLKPSIAHDFLGGYGPSFVCNPHIQDKPNYLALVYNYSDNMNDYHPQGWKGTFQPFYDFDSSARRTTSMEILFSKSGQSTGPDSSEDGGWGDFNDGTDTISLPGLPGLSALSSGFVNMYNPTAAEITTMAQILWTTDPGTAIKNWLQAPMDSIVSLGIMPLAPDISSTKVHVVVGNFVISTNDLPPVYMDSYPLTNQYKIFDCGSLNMNEYWGNALDYSPYSKAEIFLPYIGVKEIDINDVMAATLHLQYIVDFLTGTCTAQLQCVKAQHMDFSAPLYHWQGNMMSQIPTNGADFGQFITAITSTLVSAGLTVATGGSGAVIAAGVAGGALNMANAHPRIEKGGTIAMIAGAMDNQTPYIILTRPIQSKPANFQGFKGWPSNITAEIGSLTGYTEIEYIHVEIDSATDEEKSEIERLLKEGVII